MSGTPLFGVMSARPLIGQPQTAEVPRAGAGFSEALQYAVERVSQLQLRSDAEIRQWLTGETEDLHKTLLAVQKSEMVFEMLLQVRNKVVQAYQEIMRMQV